MNKEDFTKYVDLALADGDLAVMRPVVEKELLHYEIFSALDDAGLLTDLVFQGGTSLRLCRGSERFSEDLDFAGGKEFTAESMVKIKECVESRIGERFGLKVTVKEPKKNAVDGLVNVDKWMVSIETVPGSTHIPRQKIKLEIANIPAYTQEPVPLRMNYSVLNGQRPTIVNTETVDEVLADKVVALPTSISKFQDGEQVLTPTRTRHRDIWDIAWLLEQGAKLDVDLVNRKILDYGIKDFGKLVEVALQQIPSITQGEAFKAQMQRFIKASTLQRTLNVPSYCIYMSTAVGKQFSDVAQRLSELSQDQADGDGENLNSLDTPSQ
jgi:hypothetical protein